MQYADNTGGFFYQMEGILGYGSTCVSFFIQIAILILLIVIIRYILIQTKKLKEKDPS